MTAFIWFARAVAGTSARGVSCLSGTCLSGTVGNRILIPLCVHAKKLTIKLTLTLTNFSQITETQIAEQNVSNISQGIKHLSIVCV